MNADGLVALVSIAGGLILTGAALYRRRFDPSRLWQLALLWVAIITTVAGAITLGLRLR